MSGLAALVAAELAEPIDRRVSAMAAAIAARHPGALGIIFYGSCLRDATLSGMLDFYLIVEDYGRAYGGGWRALANRLLPPNVFPFAEGGLAAKYAVLSLGDLTRECGLAARSTSVWARFAQPSRLAWAADARAKQGLTAAIAQCGPTLFQLTLPMMSGSFPPEQIWSAGFALTYSAELRAERGERPTSIVDAFPERYLAFTQPVLAEVARQMGVGPNGDVPNLLSPQAMNRWWRSARRKGKCLTVLRLIKASLTFADGIDYLAWKINRHAGAKIAITPWQRRHPLLAAVTLLPRLLRSGAVR